MTQGGRERRSHPWGPSSEGLAWGHPNPTIGQLRDGLSLRPPRRGLGARQATSIFLSRSLWDFLFSCPFLWRAKTRNMERRFPKIYEISPQMHIFVSFAASLKM